MADFADEGDDMFSALDTNKTPVASPSPAPAHAPMSAASPAPFPPSSPAPGSPAVSHHYYSSDAVSGSKTTSTSSLPENKSAFQLQWDADQAKRVEEQKKKEEQKRKENTAQAQKQIKQFYADRDEKKRAALQNLKNTEQPAPTGKDAASWANISNLVDLSDKGRKSEKDTTKFKSILIEMKQHK